MNPFILLAQVTSADPTSVLLQYGALGVMVLAAGIAVRVMYGRLVSAYEREKERADRLETELRQLNQMVRNEYVGTIGSATRAIADANQAVTNALSAVRWDGRR